MSISPILAPCQALVLMIRKMPSGASEIFELPMSKNARKLLYGMLNSMSTYISTRLADCAEILYRGFNPILFENCVHKYQVDTLLKKLPKRINGLEQFEYYIQLKFLEDDKWFEKSEIPRNRYSIAALNDAASDLYIWLRHNFLLSDFTDADLGKISHLGTGTFNVDIIKEEASKIRDPDKRSVAYLYAIVRDIAIRQHAIEKKDKIISEASIDKLASVVAVANGPKLEYLPLTQDEIEIEKEFARVAREMPHHYDE